MSVVQIGTRVHIIGVGGAGMSGLGRLLGEMGAVVSGSDLVDSPVLDALRTTGVDVGVGHDAARVRDVDVVMWSPAVPVNDVELAAARAAGSRLMTRAEVLADLEGLRRVIGLTGTHGKTTATSMMVQVMVASGADDGWLLGADVLGVGANGHWGSGDLILEVDESYGTFALLRPYALGLLNVEADHLDHYGTLEALDHAFARLVDRVRGPVVVWHDDPGVRRVTTGASRDLIRVGTDSSCDWQVTDVVVARRRSTFTMRGPRESFDVALGVTGVHNVANAAVVAVLARSLGVASEAVVEGLRRFAGAPRRFQFLGTWRDCDVYEDYAHLPGEIAATLAATRASGYQRIIAVFQPHRITRTIALASSFAPAFDGATHVVVTDVYAAGESNPTGVTGEVVANAIRARRGAGAVSYCPTLDDVVTALVGANVEADVIALLGAGDVAAVYAQLSENSPT